MPTRIFSLFLAAALLNAAENPEWIRKLGGKIEQDAVGNVLGVNLSGRWVNDTEMLQLAALPKLERLDLSHTRISDEGLLHLRPARQLRDLNLLYAEQITNLGMNVIKGWTNLTRLNLRGTRISDATLAIIGKLPQIESLDIANTAVTDNGLDHLVPLTKLKHLAIGRSRSNDSALSIIRVLSTLESLDLSGPRGVQRNQRQSDSGLPPALLQAIGDLKELRVLKLGHTSLTSEDLRGLMDALPKLEKLGLENCPRLDDQAVTILASWKSLKYLDVQDTKIIAAAIDQLKRDRPDLKVLSGPFTSKKLSQ